MAGEESGVPYEQMRKQLKGFPEVHWAAVPFSLIHPRNKQRQTDLDTTRLSEAMAPFFGAGAGENSGFLDSPEIGRASCRERGDVAVVGGAVEQKGGGGERADGRR